MKVGTRVEIPSYCETWMRGARFGVIVKIVTSRTPGTRGGQDCFVKLDKLPRQRTTRYVLDDCKEV